MKFIALMKMIYIKNKKCRKQIFPKSSVFCKIEKSFKTGSQYSNVFGSFVFDIQQKYFCGKKINYNFIA